MPLHGNKAVSFIAGAGVVAATFVFASPAQADSHTARESLATAGVLTDNAIRTSPYEISVTRSGPDYQKPVYMQGETVYGALASNPGNPRTVWASNSQAEVFFGPHYAPDGQFISTVRSLLPLEYTNYVAFDPLPEEKRYTVNNSAILTLLSNKGIESSQAFVGNTKATAWGWTPGAIQTLVMEDSQNPERTYTTRANFASYLNDLLDSYPDANVVATPAQDGTLYTLGPIDGWGGAVTTYSALVDEAGYIREFLENDPEYGSQQWKVLGFGSEVTAPDPGDVVNISVIRQAVKAKMLARFQQAVTHEARNIARAVKSAPAKERVNVLRSAVKAPGYLTTFGTYYGTYMENFYPYSGKFTVNRLTFRYETCLAVNTQFGKGSARVILTGDKYNKVNVAPRPNAGC